VKIRKRQEVPEEVSEDSSVDKKSKEKKRKWATGSSSSATTSADVQSQASNIVISTDVLNTIVSSNAESSHGKGEKDSRKSKNKSRRTDSTSPARQAAVENEVALDPNDADSPSKKQGKEGEKKRKRSSGGGGDGDLVDREERRSGDREKSKSKAGKEGKEEDLEEGEHKMKHAPISFSEVDSSQALKTVKVKGKPSEEAAVATEPPAEDSEDKTIEKPAATQPKITPGPLPKREETEEVPPARNPVSTIVHIMRLTRPFTEGQLKAMLVNFGEIIHEEFWIDDIKSQCYVKYKEDESAKKCRESLFGCKWPATNPRTLKLEFVSQIQLDDVRGILKKKITKRRSSSRDRQVWNGRVEHLGRSNEEQIENANLRKRSPNIIRTANGLERKPRAKDWKRRSRSGSRESFSDYPIGNKMARVDHRQQQHMCQCAGAGVGMIAQTRGTNNGDMIGCRRRVLINRDLQSGHHDALLGRSTSYKDMRSAFGINRWIVFMHTLHNVMVCCLVFRC